MGLTQFLQGRLAAEAHGPYMKTVSVQLRVLLHRKYRSADVFAFQVNEDMPKFIDGALGVPSVRATPSTYKKIC